MHVGNDDDDTDSLNGFIVDDDEDEDDVDYGKASSKKNKPTQMSNRAVVHDSEDDNEHSEVEGESPPRAKDLIKERARTKGKGKREGKGKGKAVATTFTWTEVSTPPSRGPKRRRSAQLSLAAQQEPSTKLLWAYNELERMFRENPDGTLDSLVKNRCKC